MRRLTVDELAAVASELGATATGDLSGLVVVQQVDEVVEALAALVVAIVGQRPFDRRNHAVAVVALGLLARLNGRTLDLTPAEDVATLIAGIRDGLAAGEVRAWLGGRLADAAPLPVPVPGPRSSTCPACSMPLREALAVLDAGRIALPVCGGCGHLLSRPVPHRSPQEV